MNAPTTPATCEQRAIDKSKELDPNLVRISKVRPGVYSVLGQSGWYEVTVSREGYTCTCTAGANNRPACWHRASAYRLRLACRSLKTGQAVRPAHYSQPEPKTSAREELFGRI